MRIGLNCQSFLNRQYAGIGRYTYNLIRCLLDLDRETEYRLYVRKGLFDFAKRLPDLPSGNFRLCVDRFRRGMESVTGPLDIFHATSPGPLHGRAQKTVVTVHDVVYKAHPQGHTRQTLEATDRQMKEICRRADHIICVSAHTEMDMRRYFEVPAANMTVVHQGVDKSVFRPLTPAEEQGAAARLRLYGIQGPFVLFVGTIEPRKNVDNAIRAFALLKQRGQFDGQFVISGKTGWRSEHIPGLVAQCGLQKDVLYVGYCPDDDVRLLMNKARLFLFPSYYEGFGFPILEAFSCGAAVVTSRTSACSEIAGQAALLTDPSDPRSIAEAAAGILTNHELERSLREKGLKRAGEFSFERTARETLAVYKKLGQVQA